MEKEQAGWESTCQFFCPFLDECWRVAGLELDEQTGLESARLHMGEDLGMRAVGFFAFIAFA